MNIQILADASLPGLTEAFPAPFQLTFYHRASEIPLLLKGKDILLCRSTLSVNESLIDDASLKIVATASSGTDHIHSAYLASRAIHLVDAKGSNASSVADYILSCLAYLKTALKWHGRLAGIIGVGAVGMEVATRLRALGFEVISYDPPQAECDPHFKSARLSDLFQCDLLCIHANRHDLKPYPSIDLLNKTFLKRLRPNTVILNASRGGIVNEEALLNLSKSLIYCTDVYKNEPFIDSRIIQFATLCTPHIAGHSIEAKQRAVTMISDKLHAYYHLLPPLFTKDRSFKKLVLGSDSSWENLVLSLYNPWQETEQLKNGQTNTLDKVFQSVRQAHHYRHDFNCCC